VLDIAAIKFAIMRFAIGLFLLILNSCGGDTLIKNRIEKEELVDLINIDVLNPSINPKIASGEYGFYISGKDSVFIWNIPDSILRIEMDRLLVEDTWFTRKKRLESSIGYFTTYKNLVAVDNVWFSKKQSSEFMIISLYTDYHRVNQILGQSDNVNDNTLDAIYVFYKPNNYSYDSIATNKDKKNGFKGLLSNGLEANSNHFKTKQGIELGLSLKDVSKIYNKPDSTYNTLKFA
jgi:hypothetical protein